MATNVSEIQNRIAAYVDQKPTSPTDTSDEWNLRLKYINMAQSEWGELYDWPNLYTEYNTMTSTATGNATVALPTDFRKVASYPKAVPDGSNDYEYAEIRPQEKERRSTTDRYFYLYGDESAGYSYVFNPGTSGGQFTSGASIFISYYAEPASLASPTDVSKCPDADFLTQRSIAYLLEARQDPRFQIAKLDAEKSLQRMLERENTHSEANDDKSRIKTVEETRYGFRIGRD
jgi:hypothetical protein